MRGSHFTYLCLVTICAAAAVVGFPAGTVVFGVFGLMFAAAWYEDWKEARQ